MLKKICFSLIIGIASSQQVLCGTGSSIPIQEGKERTPARNRPNPQKNNFPKINFEEVALSSDSQSYSSGATSESSDEGPIEEATEGNRNFPAIDLGYHHCTEDIILYPQSSRVDLHPVYNKNFHSYLADEIFRLQRDYHFSKIPDAKVFILTGTGQSRPGPNFTLKNIVLNLLKTNKFFSRRISNFYPGEGPDAGFVKVFLRKNIKPQSSENGQAEYVMGKGWGCWQIDLRGVDFGEGMGLSLRNMHINLNSYLIHQFSEVRNTQTRLAEVVHLRDQMIQRAGLSNQRSKEPDTSSEEEDREVYILTGKGNKFPGNNLTLKSAVMKSLELKCFQALISGHDATPEQGLSIFLKRNIGY